MRNRFSSTKSIIAAALLGPDYNASTEFENAEIESRLNTSKQTEDGVPIKWDYCHIQKYAKVPVHEIDCYFGRKITLQDPKSKIMFCILTAFLNICVCVHMTKTGGQSGKCH